MTVRLPIIDAARCSSCGGECCKRMPGSATPADFPDLVVLEEAIRGGRWTLDCWDGDVEPGGDLHRVLYPRPAIKGYTHNAMHAAWGGPCTFHGPNGCALEYAARPEQCRELVPGSEEAGCHSELTKEAVALMWRPHAAALEEMLARIDGERRIDLVARFAQIEARP